jgi:hypothetical protein
MERLPPSALSDGGSRTFLLRMKAVAKGTMKDLTFNIVITHHIERVVRMTQYNRSSPRHGDISIVGHLE